MKAQTKSAARKGAILLVLFLIVTGTIFASGDKEDREEEYFAPTPMGGVLVTSVIEGSPAENAGIKVGDVIFAVNGEHIYPWEVLNDVAALKPGEKIVLNLLRTPESDSGYLLEREMILPLTVGTNDAGNAFLGIEFTVPRGGMRGDGDFRGPGMMGGRPRGDWDRTAPAQTESLPDSNQNL